MALIGKVWERGEALTPNKISDLSPDALKHEFSTVGLGECSKETRVILQHFPWFPFQGSLGFQSEPFAELSTDWGVGSDTAASFWISLTSFKKICIFPTLIETLAEVLSLSVCVPEH